MPMLPLRLVSRILYSFHGPDSWIRGDTVLSWNGWRRRHWPADVVRPGLRFYDVHVKNRKLTGLLEVIRGGSFEYRNRREFEDHVHRLTRQWPDTGDPYWTRMAPRGTGLAIWCRVLKPLAIPFRLPNRFPQLGWLHLGSTTELDTLRHDAADLYEEGHRALRRHLSIERNPRLRSAAKTHWTAKLGRLRCLACSFDFEKRYGRHGSWFTELHHLLPLGGIRRAKRFRATDLLPLCANCHRMVHRDRDHPLSLNHLRRLLRKR